MSTLTFSEIGLSDELLKGIAELGFETPTPIQAKAIPYLLENQNDLIALAQTGTGKTAAFGLPIIEQLDKNAKVPQALILCPTRELCMQITADLEKFCKYMQKVSIVAVYGGASIENQLKKLKSGVQIIAATPGRMNDIIRRRKVDLTQIKTVVLDEADEMLNMGFQEELNAILAETPAEKNTLLFSATMPKEVAEIAMNYMDEPYEITAGKKNVGAENVSHIYYMVHAKDRYLALKRLADINPNIFGIVFCRTRKETKDVADNLIQDGYNADALHGDLSQAQRDYVMNKFRNKNLHLLVATDVAARGLDVDDLTHVINYNLPEDFELYTHRSGRTGRAGKSGTSIAIVNMREKGKIKRIEKIINKKFEQRQVPAGKEICEAQLFTLIDRMQNVEVDDEQIAPYLDMVYKKLESFDKEDLIKHFVSLEFNRFLDYYKNSRDLNVGVEGKGKERVDGPSKGKKASREDGFDRLFVNLGEKDKLRPRDLIRLINDEVQERDVAIGEIDIKGTFTFFDVDSDFTDVILEALEGCDYHGRTVRIEKAQPVDSSTRERSKRRDFSKGRRRGDRDRGGERGGDRGERGDRRKRKRN